MLLANLLNDFGLFEEAFDRGYQYPRIQIHSNDDNLLLVAEVPSISETNLKVSVNEDVVTISGNKKKSDDQGEKFKTLRSEILNGSFTRKIELPFVVESENTKASLKNGLLSLHLPIKEKEKLKTIKIEGE